MSVTIIYDALKKFGAFSRLNLEDQEKLANKFELVRAGTTSKYSNMNVIYEGEKYHSLSEAYYAHLLDTLLVEGKIKHIQRQVPYKLEDMYGHLRLRYVADFVVVNNRDEEFNIDVKGRLTDDNKIKLAYFRHVYKKAIWLVPTSGPSKFDTSFLD